MPDNIHESLKSMAVSVVSLLPMDRNPRVGDINAIAASYEEFGQVKPIVATKNDDGTATVIAGNHQLAAAALLGWDKIAVVFLEADSARATAYALADNRTMELGYSDPEMLMELISEINDDYQELFEELGWDEFEIAEYEQESLRSEGSLTTSSSYIPPVIVSQEEHQALENEKNEKRYSIEESVDGEKRIVPIKGADHSDVAVRGVTVSSPSAAPQAVVQYTIVFDSVDQQSKWYDFIRWLKSDPAIDGNTNAERLINFIQEHTPAG
jgi:ParB-like chromosome segregation protein Spo0J